MAGRAWHTGEVRTLRECYGSVPNAEIGRRLNRSADAVGMYARKLGLGREYQTRSQRALLVKAGHARGLHDGEIAKGMGICRETVTYHRRCLGLPTNRNNARHAKKVAKGVKRQCEDNGVGSLPELRLLAMRIECANRGWPEAVTVRQCDLLDLLEQEGPQTKRQIQEAFGLLVDEPAAGSRAPEGRLPAQKPWIAVLIRQCKNLGLVACLGRKAKGSGRGHSCALYALADGVARRQGKAFSGSIESFLGGEQCESLSLD